MVKKPTRRMAADKQVAKAALPDGLVNAAPVPYPVANISITALQVYQNPDRKPSGDGPWNNEADKVSWIDETTGLGCIMLRQRNGTISGFVGVGPEHPLFGFEADAVPVGVSNTVHGGVTYGKACEVNRFERRAHGKPRQERYTVCHTSWVRTVQDYRTVQTTEDQFHEDLWWLGFDTDHAGDLVPGGRYGEGRKGDVYRDQSFVYANCIELARKLKSLVADHQAEVATDSPDGEATAGKPLGLPPPTGHGGE